MSLPDWLREAEESVTDGGIIAGPQARRLLALVRKMGEALEAEKGFMIRVIGCEDCRKAMSLFCLSHAAEYMDVANARVKVLHTYRHGPEVGERRIHPHDLRGIVGQDGRIAGFVCRRCSRVAWLNKGFADCSEADADVIQQLGESCEGAEVDEA